MAPDASHERLTTYNIIVICLIGLGSVCFGYAGSIIGTLLAQPSFIEYFELGTRAHATQLESSMNGIYQAGSVVGSLVQPFIADKLGRRWALAAPALLLIVATAGMAGATHIAIFIVFRFFAGAAAIVFVATPPFFMAELVPSHYRGGLVEMHAIFFQSGYVVSGWIGYGTFYWKYNINVWRLSTALQAVPPILLLCALPYIPESPRWLLMNGRIEDARRVLETIHEDSETGREKALAQLHHIQIQADLDRRLGSSWKDILKKRAYVKRFALGMATTTISQFSGVLVMATYGTVIYRTLSYDTEKQLMFQALWLTSGIVCMFVAPFMIDKVPRNRMMGCGMIGCGATLSILASIIANFANSANTAALKAGIAVLFLYQPFFAILIDGPQYVFLAEIFPTHLRAKGVCAATAIIGVWNIIWLQVAETAFETIGWKYFLVFIIPSFLGGFAMWFFWPDTRDMPLEEISALFGDDGEVAVNAHQLDFNDKSEERPVHVEDIQV